MAAPPALPRKTLHNELAALVRNMIIEGELSPGSRIPESHLCDLFGVSRTPLREALKVLSVEGLVYLLPNKGARVAHVTRQEMEEIVPILGTLAALSGELACANIKADELARIRSMHIQLVKHYHAGDQQSYSEVNHAIHDAVFAAAGNRILSDTFNVLQTRLRSILFVTPKAPPQWAEAVADHEEMITALEEKDGSRFAAIARRHVYHKADMIRIALNTLEAREEDSKNPPARASK